MPFTPYQNQMPIDGSQPAPRQTSGTSGLVNWAQQNQRQTPVQGGLTSWAQQNQPQGGQSSWQMRPDTPQHGGLTSWALAQNAQTGNAIPQGGSPGRQGVANAVMRSPNFNNFVQNLRSWQTSRPQPGAAGVTPESMQQWAAQRPQRP